MILSKRLVAVAAVFAGALASTAPAVQAQGGAAGQGMSPADKARVQQMQKAAATQQAKMFKDLGVTDAQKAKIASLQKGFATKMATIQKKYPNIQADMAQRQKASAEAMPLIMQMQKDVMAVFTPAQRTKIEKMQAEQMKKMQGSMGGMGGGTPGRKP